MKTPWRIHECALARWRISLDAFGCSSRHVNTVYLSCHPGRSEGSRGHKAMNNKVDVHEILRRKAPLDDKIENFHIESHAHLQRKSIRMKISSFLWRMCWNPSATSVTVVWQMTIARCRWSATIVRWFHVWYAFVAVLQWLLQMFWCKWRNRPFHRRVNRVKGPWSMLYVYAYARARNNIKVSSENRLQMSWNPPETNPSTNQRVSKKFAESCKKEDANIWQICCKAVILHPLSREKRGSNEILKHGWGNELPLWERNFSKKTSKSFGGSKICLTFASAFRKKAVKEEFFERFRYKQASSTGFVKWQITETVNTWLK